MSPFVLSEQDRNSALWVDLRAYFEARLDHLRKQNDADKTQEQTARLRGRIAECKFILALDKPAPERVADDN